MSGASGIAQRRCRACKHLERVHFWVPTHNHSGQVVKLSYARERAQQQRHAPEHQERLLGHSLPRDWVPHSVEVHLYSFAPWFSLTQQDDSTPRESLQSVEAAAREDIHSFLALPCPLLTVFVPLQISASWITALPPHRLHHSEHLPIKNNIIKFSGELFLVEFDEPLFMVEKLEIVHE
ncbi:hypothetical protein V8E53_011353 [Lactarius tabidus]